MEGPRGDFAILGQGSICSATGSETHYLKWVARGSVGRGFLNECLECTGHTKQKNKDKLVKSWSNMCTLLTATWLAATTVAGRYGAEGPSCMMVAPRCVSSSNSLPA